MIKRHMVPMPVVMIPSTRNILRQDITEPIGSVESSPDARRPPTAHEDTFRYRREK